MHRLPEQHDTRKRVTVGELLHQLWIGAPYHLIPKRKWKQPESWYQKGNENRQNPSEQNVLIFQNLHFISQFSHYSEHCKQLPLNIFDRRACLLIGWDYKSLKRHRGDTHGRDYWQAALQTPHPTGNWGRICACAACRAQLLQPTWLVRHTVGYYFRCVDRLFAREVLLVVSRGVLLSPTAFMQNLILYVVFPPRMCFESLGHNEKRSSA